MQNNNPQSINNNRKLWIIIGIIFFVVIILVAMLVVSKSTPSEVNPQQESDQNLEPTFEGISSFIDSGLSTNQVNNLVNAFKSYSPRAQNIVIDSNSLVPAARNPNGSDPSFTINFTLSVDSKAYKGKVTYSGLDYVRLFLYSKDGKLIFDSIDTN